jgi:endonuclease/exonuclease/phosphatase family metal-dependent hydrolase
MAAAGGHVVVAGDFSASPDTNAMRFRRGLGSLEGRSIAYRTPGRPSSATTTDSPSARTTLVSGGNWPLKLGRRIDYILVHCDENGPPCVYATAVASSTSIDGVWASDHFGLTANLAPTNADEHRGS